MPDNTKTSALTDHLEDGFSQEQATTAISYDNNGISGIIRSPYVFGAGKHHSLPFRTRSSY